MPEKILITGGAGFTGRAVCREVLKRGHEVRVLDSLIAGRADLMVDIAAE